MRYLGQSEETILSWPVERRNSYIAEMNKYFEALNRK
jgi:hypothetical protein